MKYKDLTIGNKLAFSLFVSSISIVTIILTVLYASWKMDASIDRVKNNTVPDMMTILEIKSASQAILIEIESFVATGDAGEIEEFDAMARRSETLWEKWQVSPGDKVEQDSKDRIHNLIYSFVRAGHFIFKSSREMEILTEKMQDVEHAINDEFLHFDRDAVADEHKSSDLLVLLAKSLQAEVFEYLASPKKKNTTHEIPQLVSRLESARDDYQKFPAVNQKIIILVDDLMQLSGDIASIYKKIVNKLDLLEDQEEDILFELGKIIDIQKKELDTSSEILLSSFNFGFISIVCIGFFSLFVTVVVFWNVKMAIDRDFTNLLQSTKVFSEGNYSHRTTVIANDEIGTLAVSFNEMAEKLEKSFHETLEARNEAQASSKAKSEFLANMSHEIRTPLNGIFGMVELALDTCIDDVQKEIFFTINSEVDSLLSIINDILDFSKIEAGKLELEEIPFDLVTMFENIALSNAINAEQRQLEFIAFIDPATPAKLIGDPGRLRQILMNLIGNALKFTPEGEVFVNARMLEESAQSAQIYFQVKDTGIGIPQDKLDAVFDSFTQADGSTTRKYGGTGLGISICKQLVEMMGGKIGVESKEGEGSSFWFTVVLKKQSEKQLRVKSLDDEDLHGLKVLLVDDNYTNLTILDSYFKSWGCDAVSASSGPQALDKLHQAASSASRFDLILTDHHMPEMDGFEFVEEIRKKNQMTSIPIVMFTSAGSPGDGKRCKEYGINGYLAKPIRRSELKNAIKTVLGFARQKETSARQDLVTKHSVNEKFGKSIQNVLFVEDYAVSQKVVSMFLAGAGYKVDIAANGIQAVDVYQSKAFDIVLMDVQMPEMDGYEATRRIREIEQNTGKRTPIIAVTAFASEEDRKKCLDAGMDDFITKPLRRKMLLDKLGQWLDCENASADDIIEIGRHQSSDNLMNTAASRLENTLPETPPVDLVVALDEFRGDKELFLEVADEFIRSTEGRIEKIAQAIGTGKSEVVEVQGHTLKGGAGNLCAERLAQLAFELERAGFGKDQAKSSAYLEQFKMEFLRLKVFIENMRS